MNWNDWILQKNIDFTLDKLGVSRQEMTEYLEKGLRPVILPAQHIEDKRNKDIESVSGVLDKLNTASKGLSKQFRGTGFGKHSILDQKHLAFPKALPLDICIHSDYGDLDHSTHLGNTPDWEVIKEHMMDRDYIITNHMKSLGYTKVEEEHKHPGSSKLMRSHLFRKSREFRKSDEENEEPDWKRAGLTIKDTNDRKTGHLNLPLLTDYKSFHNMEPDELLINREDMKSKKPSKPKKKLKF